MGGISVLIMLGAASALSLAALCVVGVAVLLFVAATVTSIVFACTASQRRLEGRTLGWRLAIPLVMYAISVPILITIAFLIALSATA